MADGQGSDMGLSQSQSGGLRRGRRDAAWRAPGLHARTPALVASIPYRSCLFALLPSVGTWWTVVVVGKRDCRTPR